MRHPQSAAAREHYRPTPDRLRPRPCRDDEQRFLPINAVINNPFMGKIKIAETTDFAEICEKKIHKHRFRRKKRQKSRRNSQGE